MDRTRTEFDLGGRLMTDAFAELSALAHRHGAGFEEIAALRGRFFDGSVASRHAFAIAVLLAEIGGATSD